MSEDAINLALRELELWQSRLTQTEAYQKVKLWENVISEYKKSNKTDSTDETSE